MTILAIGLRQFGLVGRHLSRWPWHDESLNCKIIHEKEGKTDELAGAFHSILEMREAGPWPGAVDGAVPISQTTLQ